MKKIIAFRFVLPLAAALAITAGLAVAKFPSASPNAQTGTLETFIVASGNVAMNLDVNRLNGLGNGVASKPETLRFDAVRDSFFPVLVFNNELRGPDLGSIGLVPRNSVLLPAALNDSFNQLVVEKVLSDSAYDLVIRDAKTGLVFFNVEGNSYKYDALTASFQIENGRLLMSEEFAKTVGRPADAGMVVGSLSMNAALRMIETRNVVNGVDQSAVLPAATSAKGDAPDAIAPGPDVIVGDLPSMQQFGSSGTQVGLAIGTTSCNNGNVELNWFALPNVDHPVIPQNLYRMSSNADRFEQIGQSWLKHAFTALQQTTCGACTSASNGTHLGVGCSDPYTASLNGGQSGLGSRAWVNPFTGAYPSTSRNHSGHTESGTSHRILVEAADLLPASNVGATYFGEAQYVTPHEYAWCQAHPGECNMYNNASYRRFTVSGSGTSFTFGNGAATVRQAAAITAWTGATVNTIEPAPGIDGRGFVAYKVSGPTNGVYHYEYAVNNQNLDRAIQSFSVPLGCGVAISNIGFHAPLNETGSTNDGTVGNAGISNAAWTSSQTTGAVTWSGETFAQNPNANVIRWGTLFNFRFDSTRAPQTTNATIGFYKTGEPITVAIQAPTPDACFDVATAVSRKTHGAAGTFDVDLPFSGSPGIESRSGGAGGNHTIVVTFTSNVVSGNAQITDGTGSVSGSPTFTGNTMTVALTGVPNAQQLTMKLSNVTDSSSQVLPDKALTMKVLFGDSNGNSAVTSSDVAMVKAEAGNAVSATNFRSDLTADGNFSSSDIGAVKSMAGSTLP